MSGKGLESDMAEKNEIDMIHGSLADKLLKVALPLAAISVLQQMFNACDVAVVGRFGSPTALAAVGANVTIVNMFLTFFSGLATGGNVTLSNLIGQGKKERISDCVHTLFTLSLISAVLVLAVGQLIARPLLHIMNTPDNIMQQAELYLRIFLFAMMFAVIYNFSSAILRSKGDTKRPMYCLIASGVLNIILNLVFVLGLHLDVAGVAIATLLSNMVCAASCVFLLVKEEGEMHLNLKKLRIRKDVLMFTLRIGLPAGIQGMLFSVSNMIIQSGINSFGDDCISGNTAAANYEYITYFVVNAFGQTATTFVSQNYGAGEKKRCRKVIRESMGMALVLSALVGGCFLLGSRLWLGFFTTKEAIYEYAYIRMYSVVVLEFLTSFNEMGGAGLRGRGISLPPTIISILGSCIFRIIWMKTVFAWNHKILILMLVYPVSWIFLAACMLTAYTLQIYREKESPHSQTV